MNTTQKDLLFLLCCAVNRLDPKPERVRAMDLEELYRISKFHSVRAAVCIVLERAGIRHEKFHDAYKKSVRKNIYHDLERTAILAEFEKQDIWYLPLKGIILKEIYPENGMREMSDNDILYDAKKQQIVKQIMVGRGYKVKYIDSGHDDVYTKPPVLNFEMHTALFGVGHSEVFNRYYTNVKRLMIKDSEGSFGYHLSDEDFYVFMTAHEYKHYSKGGTGIRSLLDCYVFIKHTQDTMDMAYISEQCEKLEISDFENKRRALAIKIFSKPTLPPLTVEEQEMLRSYLGSGVFGTVENSIRKSLSEKSRARYVMGNLFPSLEYTKRSVGFVKKCPVLYPFGIIYRWGRVLFCRRNYLSAIIKVMKKDHPNKSSDHRRE
ncbi:MAG: nucleotidyltransferase family protein [Ruminococcus sp.]|nr:nucleotidyltransferase family protein [Ruminococcus sp.]